MRWISWMLLAFIAAPLAADEEEGVVTSEELNFYIKMPDSIDWKVEKIDEASDKRLKAHFSTEFVDLGDGSLGEVGELELESEGRMLTFNSGEVSLRPT